jgi:hydrogenase nickel incorporation protein HypA/HybF
MHELSIAVSLIETACDHLASHAQPAGPPPASRLSPAAGCATTPANGNGGNRGQALPRVLALHLRLGPLAGVVKEALLFSFDLAAEGTPIAGARLQIEDVPVVVYCPRCAARRTLASIQNFCCPVCGEPTPEVLEGRELELKSMEVSVDDDPHP